jgi:hypothetical protein
LHNKLLLKNESKSVKFQHFIALQNFGKKLFLVKNFSCGFKKAEQLPKFSVEHQLFFNFLP